MKILFIFGTRPEAIKIAPIIKYCKEKAIDYRVCNTGQHADMVMPILDFFNIIPDYNLSVMTQNQSLASLTSKLLSSLEKIDYKPNLIFVQGDTTSALIGGLFGFYNKIKVCHIEAGLRTFNKHSPFPEEMNRVLIGKLSDFHFAPTKTALENLETEGVRNVYNVGNTVIDSLFLTDEIISKDDKKYQKEFDFLDPKLKTILVTCHRRESIDKLDEIARSLIEIARHAQIIFPMHPNPNVRVKIKDLLSGIKNIHLVEPIDYPFMIYIMKKCDFLITDSGGLQEEAPSFAKPVIIIRNETERMEIIDAGIGFLCGTDFDAITTKAMELLGEDLSKYKTTQSPFGDGKSSERILKILSSFART
jgi:UDP-N-acetylglucosamine 2-epimerase (non-hydrolysing)